jgi:hypothetical protein
MAQIPSNVSKCVYATYICSYHSSLPFVSIKLEEKHVFSEATAPQVSTASVSNNSTADILNSRRRFFATLLPHAAAADYKYEELDCDEYDEVKFWDQDSFNKWFCDLGKTGSPTPHGQLSKKLYFLEDEDGERIDQNEISAMRRALKHLFSMIKEHIPDMTAKWLQMSSEFHDMVYLELHLLFPQYLSLCKNNWKACEFAKNCIRNWSHNHSKKGKTASDDKSEDQGRDHGQASGSVGGSSSKRRLKEAENLDSASAAKKAKTVTKAKPVNLDPLWVSMSLNSVAEFFFSSHAVKIKPTPHLKSKPKPSPVSPPPSEPTTTASPMIAPSHTMAPSTTPDSAGSPLSMTAIPSTTTLGADTSTASPDSTTIPGPGPSTTSLDSTTIAPGPMTGASSTTQPDAVAAMDMSPNIDSGSIEKAPSPHATDDGFQGQSAGQSGIILIAYSAPTAPPSTSFNESQKKSAADFVAAMPKDTKGIEVAKKGGRGRAKATSAEAVKGGGQTSITAPRQARGNRNATTAQ